MLRGAGVGVTRIKREDGIVCPMSVKRIVLALGATVMFGILTVGSVAAAGIDLTPAFDGLIAQASPTGTPSPGATGNAGLAGDGGTPLMLGAALVLGAAVLAGTGRWMAVRRS